MSDLSLLLDQSPNIFFFPLRTNVQYFDSAETRLKLEERIKQAALLYENLLFEAGMYHATVWEQEGGGPSFDLWVPPDDLDMRSLDDDDDSFRPTGGQPFVMIDGHAFASGPAERQFRAQFHGLLLRLGALNEPWIRLEPLGLPPEIDSHIKEIGRRDEKLVESLRPDASRFLREKISYNLNRDLMLTSVLRAAASLDNLFGPLVHEKAKRIRGIESVPGFFALQVIVPNWSTLSWEEVIDLRRHPSLIEFRQKMVSIERVAREAASDNAADVKHEISLIINKELSEELFNLRVTPKQVFSDICIDLVTGATPGIDALLTGIRGEERLKRQNRSWTTAIFKLQKRV